MGKDVRIAILGDASGFSRAVSSAKRDADGLNGKLSRFSGAAKVAFAGGAVAAVGFAKTSVTAFMEAEESQAQLTAAFEKFPQLAGANIGALRDLNTQLAQKTKFDDDATASGQAVLAGFGLTQDQLAKVTPLLQDYATKTGKDLPSAATDLGKAVMGQGRALKGVGINFKDTGTAAGNFDELVGGLTDKVGGLAEVAGDTTAGKVAILKNQFGELQERVGAALVPALTKLADIFLKIGGWFNEHRPVLVAVVALIGTGLVAAFIAWAAAAASAAAATIAATWPIILIAAAIAALVAGVIYAYTHWGWFKDAVDAVARFLTQTLWPALQKVWSFIRDNLIPIIAAVIEKYIAFYKKVAEVAVNIVKAFVGVVQWFAGLPGAIGSIFSGLAEIITAPFRSAFRAIKSLWNNTVGGFGFEVPSWVPGVGGKGFQIPSMLQGGIIPGALNQPKLIMAHGGEELVAAGARNRGGGSSRGPITVVVEIGGRMLGSFLVDELDRVQASDGALRIRTR